MKKMMLIALMTLLAVLASTERAGAVSQNKVNTFFDKLMNYENEDIAPLFSDSFLSQVPAATLEQYLKVFNEKFGDFDKAVVTEGSKLKIHYEKAVMPGSIGFDDDGKVKALWFGPPKMKEDSFEKIRENLGALDGKVSVCIKKNGESIFEINPNKALAVGSTFKLYVLKAVEAEIEANKLMWQDVIRLDPELKSLPSGVLQDWPAGSPLTVRTLANAMISISDNTATDILINLIGREYIERFAPETMRPFLSTMDMFRLKFSGNDEIAERYIKADTEQRREILEEIRNIDRSEVKEENIDKPKYVSEIEWLVSTSELCDLIADLKDNPSITINPGLAGNDEWNYVGYKGGSEPGVLNYTHLLQQEKGGDLYAVSATINDDSAVDSDQEFTLIITRVIELLRAK